MKFRNPSYNKRYDEHWKIIRGVDWPLCPPRNIDEYNKLPPIIDSELKQFNWRIDPVLLHEQLLSSYPQSIVWDTENYFSIDKLLEDLKNLYKILDLGEVNESMIKEYYQLWIDKLLELSGE
jgi:hypothetical protein